MKKPLLKKILIITSISLVVSACSNSKKADNFDFSNFKPPIRESEIVKDNSQETTNIKVENKLLNFKNRDEISSVMKYGKNDPFSFESESNNNLLSNLKFKGFISTSDKDFALVRYLGEEGTITKNSVGGINTKYLPNGAKVKNFNLLDSEITISFDGQEFIITLKD